MVIQISQQRSSKAGSNKDHSIHEVRHLLQVIHLTTIQQRADHIKTLKQHKNIKETTTVYIALCFAWHEFMAWYSSVGALCSSQVIQVGIRIRIAYEKMLNSANHVKMSIKTIAKCYFTPFRMVKYQKNLTSTGEDVKNL